MPGRATGLWWWIDRWRKSTAYTDMTVTQQGAYRNLLDEAWLRGGPLPDDEAILAKACGDPRIWARVRGKVLAHFTRAPDGLRNETLDEVLAEARRRAVKQAEWRARQAGNDRGNASGNTHGNDPGNNLGSPSPSPSPSLRSVPARDPGVATGESAELDSSSTPAVLTFACVGRPPTWSLTTAQITTWTADYPNLDILEQCHMAKAWLEADPQRRKTARGMRRCLVGWFNREVNAARRGPLAGSAPQTPGAINAAYLARRRKEQA